MSLHIPGRNYNKLTFTKHSVTKSSDGNLSGEMYWYLNIPDSITHLFPDLINCTPSTEYEIERIYAPTLSQLYIEGKMTIDILENLLTHMELIHNSNPEVSETIPKDDIDMYYNYLDKLASRYHQYDYSKFPKHDAIFKQIFSYFENYIKKQLITPCVIHGDPVFTNIFYISDSFKFIDMNGTLGDMLSIYGDKWYDYGKIYQSLIGYDEILLEAESKTPITDEYRQTLRNHFETYILNKFGTQRMTNIRWITASLLFSLIPLHDNEKCIKYYNLIEALLF
jgi:hypothetical protein